LFPEVSRRSLQRDLKALLDKGLIRDVGSGVATDPPSRLRPDMRDRTRRKGMTGSCDKL